MQRGGLDYSKWDAIGDDDSDDEAGAKARPQVTRLEGPSTIHIGPGGAPRGTSRATPKPDPPLRAPRSAATDYDQWARFANAVSDDEEDDDDDGGDDGECGGEDHGAAAAPLPAPPAPSGLGAVERQSKPLQEPRTSGLTSCGGATDRYLWSQSKTDVTAHFRVPQGTRAKQVHLSLTADHIKVVIDPLGVHAEGAFPHAVVPPAESDDVDWELVDAPDAPGERLLRVGLAKDSPEGIVVWWDSLLRGDPTVDVTRFEGRDLAKASSMDASWKEAHDLFRQRVKERTPVVIDATEI